ncbi:MAG: FeoB-associated Cys-rich membrane protein [Clostridia bacterium]|nr:FeoB-associated Cys-rich membrane protein [Clostridia bacterium]
MGVLEIILIAVCAALVIGVVITSIIRKKQGKTSCDCGCDCCHCSGCSSKPKSTKN